MGCETTTSTTQEAQPVDIFTNKYPEEQAEILETWDEIIESVKEGDIDKLISFHAYGPKFTEFKQGAPETAERKMKPLNAEFLEALQKL
ncbi:hypothetical protein [Rhodohalobacter sp.]|uniref:hypothetical protein n=1 Tax=Rhodohalobacter sp. TaxID=1974210 RepID=UPI002ACEDFD8|nr:hypothetical protein [Rhodohalobacter sp.]